MILIFLIELCVLRNIHAQPFAECYPRLTVKPQIDARHSVACLDEYQILNTPKTRCLLEEENGKWPENASLVFAWLHVLPVAGA